jgi:hypothetical protein
VCVSQVESEGRSAQVQLETALAEVQARGLTQRLSTQLHGLPVSTFVASVRWACCTACSVQCTDCHAPFGIVCSWQAQSAKARAEAQAAEHQSAACAAVAAQAQAAAALADAEKHAACAAAEWAETLSQAEARVASSEAARAEAECRLAASGAKMAEAEGMSAVSLAQAAERIVDAVTARSRAQPTTHTAIARMSAA